MTDEVDSPEGSHADVVRVDRRDVRWLGLGGLLLILALVASVLYAVSAPGDEATASAEPTVDSSPDTITDDFSGDNPGGLGRASTGQRWELAQGRWERRDGAAVVRVGDGLLDSVAIVDLTDRDGVVEVTFGQVTYGTGIVIRYIDPSNYVVIEAAPGAATWGVTRVTDGRPTVLGDLGVTNTGPGTVLTVRMRGPVLDISVDRMFRHSFPSVDGPGATNVGMLSRFNARGTFDRFQASDEAALRQPDEASS